MSLEIIRSNTHPACYGDDNHSGLSWPLFSYYQGSKCSLLSSLRAWPMITIATRSPSFPPTQFLNLTFSRRRQFWIHLSTFNIEPSQWFPEWGNFFTSDILESHPHMNIVHLVFVDWENVSWRKKKNSVTVQFLLKGWGSHRTSVERARFGGMC